MKVAELVDIKAAIRFLKTSRPTFYRWMRSGKLKGLKVGRQWRFARADLERFAQGQAPRIDLPAGLGPLFTALALPAGAEPEAVARAIVDGALARGASDVHLWPRRDDSGLVVAELSYRVEAGLERVAAFERKALDAVIDQFKVLSHRDLNDRSRPQEGRLDGWAVAGGRRHDINLCFVPTALGEALTLRIQDPRSVKVTLEELPFSDGDRERMRRAALLPHGLVLVTGPTGSGKTTTLYAYVQARLKPGVKVMTVEDPVELLVDGAVQVSVNAARGVTGAVALRAILASDADVIVIGRLEDAEVAALAVQAAATGHLVVAQLAAPDAMGAIERLEGLGLDRTSIADAVRVITCQRLVRNLCEACRKPVRIDRAQVRRVSAEASAGGAEWKRAARFHAPHGCARCDQRGFRGRTMVSEVLELIPPLMRALRSRMPMERVRAMAVKEGMPTLLADGLVKAGLGITTLDEVYRVTR